MNKQEKLRKKEKEKQKQTQIFKGDKDPKAWTFIIKIFEKKYVIFMSNGRNQYSQDTCHLNIYKNNSLVLGTKFIYYDIYMI